MDAQTETASSESADNRKSGSGFAQVPSISLPKGGGAIRGLGEKFAANPVTGTGTMTIPIAASPGRSGFGPQPSMSYDSASGNGPFGLGWGLLLTSITRKTDKGLPRYFDTEESDDFILSNAEDLVPVLEETDDGWTRQILPTRTVGGENYRVQRYRPRVEGLFARIERWTNLSDASDTFWRSISRDNVTTWYGKSPNSRIADPEDSSRIFSWLICTTFDDKGNAAHYEYESENTTGVSLTSVHEANRTDESRSANRYLKRIHYGNHAPYFPQIVESDPWPVPPEGSWLFELVFDYGEHDTSAPAPDDEGDWQVRHDPFSTYRAGFEVRTYRLCHRVLMFHHFPEESDVGMNCLVRSTDFNYRHEQDADDSRNPIHTVLTSVTQSAYRRLPDGSYRKRTLPPVEFEYSQALINDDISHLDPDSLVNLPVGLDNDVYRWVDLDGEGLSGILTAQGANWYYKRNLSPVSEQIDQSSGAQTKKQTRARFAPLEEVRTMPSTAALPGATQLLDLAGDGQLDLVSFDGSTAGYYEREDGDWNTFRPFESLPILRWNDPNLRFVDLTGDGLADILITEHEALCWHPSLGEVGFGPSERVVQALEEESGPRLVFADGSQSIYLADLSGDGLIDLARIRNGEVCYWPNLGYGRFGSKITMDNAPHLDEPEAFNQQRIRLADIDGSGVTDILYLRHGAVDVYYNQSGNTWSDARVLTHVPRIDNLSSMQVADLLGNGTACLVWSSPLPMDAQSPLRYIDLMGGQKPHLLIGSKNNLGAETHVHYAPSTKYYLQDKLAGSPWITCIPFVVHVVERVVTHDHISRNRFASRYAYHHGYFDGREREFRGFGFVEQFDTEELAVLNQSGELSNELNIDSTSHVPPVLTKTWFHTGAYLDGSRISLQLKDDYFREPGLTDEEADSMLLPDTIFPEGLSAEEEREAVRSLKGVMLRQEVYGLDGTSASAHPYAVTEQNFTIKTIQPQGPNRHCVYFTHAREDISYHYERNPADPRIGHSATLEVDAFGNVLKQVAIGYGRRETIRIVGEDGNAADEPNPGLNALDSDDRKKQTSTLMTCDETGFTNSIEKGDSYRTPLPCESRSFELTGLNIDDRLRLKFELLRLAVDDATPIAFHQTPTDGVPQKRLLEHSRNLYRRNDLTGQLPLCELQSRALPFESHQLALTSEHVALVFGDRVTVEMLEQDGRYVHSVGDDNWWIPSGQVFFVPEENEPAAAELGVAAAHFFLPRRFQDAFGESTTVEYDRYDLSVRETVDPLGNRITVGERMDTGITSSMDYRVLQPALVTDPNGNRVAVAFDTLGFVAGTAVMGKNTEALGDSLEGFEADLTLDQVNSFFDAPRDSQVINLLADAGSRIVYDVTRFERLGASAPVYAATIARETHVSDPVPPNGLKVQVNLAYSDGLERVIQKKAQAESEPMEQGGAPTDIRWVGSGWTVFNNKGDPVRQYEPFFSANHEFEFLREVGVSPTLFYDPVGRVVATLHPNHAWEKVISDPWLQETWDVNDTVLRNPVDDKDVGTFFGKLHDDDYLPTWHALRTDTAHSVDALARWPDDERRLDEANAADKAAAHADTPGIAHLDALGRAFLSIADNGTDDGIESRTEQDIEGAILRVIDARSNTVMVYRVNAESPDGNVRQIIGYDIAGRQFFEHSMDGGDRHVLMDIASNPIRSWDSLGHTFRTRYDTLRRPTHLFVESEIGEEALAEMTVYGEGHPDAERNLRGQVYQQYDCAGVVISERFDYKGNALQGKRRLTRDYRQTVSWSVLSQLTELANIEVAAESLLEAEVFATETKYDALDRSISTVNADGSVTLPAFNEANLLEQSKRPANDTLYAFCQVTDSSPSLTTKRVHHERQASITESYCVKTT